MTDDTPPDIEDITTDLVMGATGSIVRVFEYLSEHYGDHYPSDVELNRVFVKVLADLLGDMLGHFPDGSKEEIIKEAYDRITYSQMMTETELSNLMAPTEGEDEVQEYRKYDLANMKPMGNA